MATYKTFSGIQYNYYFKPPLKIYCHFNTPLQLVQNIKLNHLFVKSVHKTSYLSRIFTFFSFYSNPTWCQITAFMRRQSVLFPVIECPLSLVEITVGMESDDFMRGQALTCHRLVALPLLGTTVICVQPLKGRHVTIQERSYTSTACMSLCDITIYVGKYTVSCGKFKAWFSQM